MTPTQEYLREQFGTFNNAYFGGKLPEPEFVVSNARTILGQFCCRSRRSAILRRQKLDHFTIKVTKYYDLPEREYQNVLLHEMIHYYIAYQRIKDTSAHGQVFRAMMNELNSRHGWNIKVRVDTRQWAANDKRKGKRRLVLAFRTHDGKHYLAVINGRYFDAIEKQVKRCNAILSHQWLASDDEFFIKFPVSRTLRAMKVSPETFAEKTSATPKADSATGTAIHD